MRKLYKSDYVFAMMLGFATATVVSGYFNTGSSFIFGILTVACVVILTWLENGQTRFDLEQLSKGKERQN